MVRQYERQRGGRIACVDEISRKKNPPVYYTSGDQIPRSKVT